MIEFIMSNWTVILLTLFMIVMGFYVPGFRVVWVKAFRALLSEAVLTKIFLVLAESVVKSTKNKLDDLWLEQLKKSLADKGRN